MLHNTLCAILSNSQSCLLQDQTMAQQLKSWESPRRRGRNDKGKGGSARRRQIKKQQQMLRRKLKKQSDKSQKQSNKGREFNSLPLFLTLNCSTSYTDGKLG